LRTAFIPGSFDMKKAIGGYFELELNKGIEYHSEALGLNLGRSAFEYILRAKKVKKIYVPCFTCRVMEGPLRNTGVDYGFYHIGENLEPVFDYTALQPTDYFLYTNYFGIKDNFIKKLAGNVKNLIIDNSQSFFSRPLPGVDTFYSPRKFFGVPDGGYLYTDKKTHPVPEQDLSYERLNHLTLRIDKSPEDGYAHYVKNNDDLENQAVKTMSALTRALLSNISYRDVMDRRKRNFSFLHEKLRERNEFNIDQAGLNIPMVYPFLVSNGGILRKKLIENRIYVATYWIDLLNRADANPTERHLVENFVHLPIDQRYAIAELKIVLNLIKP